jgi:tRNA nucleotidyltransferase (CCA-adding enzyme)
LLSPLVSPTAADVSFPERIEIPASILQIARTLDEAGFEAWCVGGTLRDTLLGHPHSDYDLATSATPDEVQRLFRRTVPIGVKYGTVGVLDQQRELHEVTTFRRDVTTDGRHAVVQYGVSLEDDLARRDFTINAIAYHPLRHEWRDPHHGAADLRAGVVRAVGDPAQRFQEDFLRILRALRFAARFDFAIDPLTWEAARGQAPGLARLSAERVRDEWFKSLQTATSVQRLLSLWRDSGAAQAWLPELMEATVAEPPAPVRDPVVLTALLAHNPSAVLARLKASNAEITRARAIELGPPEPVSADPVSVRRWLSQVGPVAHDLTLLWQLRHGREPDWKTVLADIRSQGDPLTRAQLAINGSDLLELGIAGRDVGSTLSALLDRVLEQPSLNRRETLLALAREMA